MQKIILGITGASGAIYAHRFLQVAKDNEMEVDIIITQNGAKVLTHEGFSINPSYEIDDLFSPPATGSSEYSGMVILPCSMGTLGRIAAGTSDNLLIRAADVCLKEGHPLIVVPREMPINEIHIENTLKLKRAGATIIPACPHFYMHPQTIDDLVDTVVERVMKNLLS